MLLDLRVSIEIEIEIEIKSAEVLAFAVFSVFVAALTTEFNLTPARTPRGVL
ncbi:MAG TPA: hypothetical protein VN939_06060 [Chthoniobacterales bacterium]|jgi:hypothetical protein|nr:hypothetical protein [Chthoniobacterales bacterium]